MIAYIEKKLGGQYLRLDGAWTTNRSSAQGFNTCIEAANVIWTFDLDEVQIVMTFGDQKFDMRVPCRSGRTGRAVRTPDIRKNSTPVH
jgi:hypothetical protein